MRNNVGKSGRFAAMMIFRRGPKEGLFQRSRAKPAFAPTGRLRNAARGDRLALDELAVDLLHDH
jgi:hypothetical protein